MLSASRCISFACPVEPNIFILDYIRCSTSNCFQMEGSLDVINHVPREKIFLDQSM